MDHMMPRLDGIEATKIIRSLGYRAPIVALTANAVTGQADMFLANGFDDFISKPIDIRQLNLVLNKLIRDRHPIHAGNAIGLQRVGSVSGSQPGKPIDSSKMLFEANPRFAEIFARDAQKALNALDAIFKKGGPFEEEDMKTYLLHVHGMKGALANVGKMDLSAIALKLEQYARKEDTGSIIIETPAFLSELRAFVKSIAPQ
jgi:CheY-like chemotaxis protein